MSDKAKKEHVESKDFRTVFVNTFGLRFGENDVGILMAAEVADSYGESFILDEVRVMMTPRSTKILSIMLSEVITEFEKVNGPIPVQEGKIEEISKALSVSREKS